MASGNVTFALTLAVAGGIAAWVGYRDPEGGLPGAIQRVSLGQKAAAVKTAGDPLQYVSTLYTPGSAGAASGASASIGGAAPASYSGAPATGVAAAIIAESAKYDGVRYVWGGTTPNGFDCSGLTQYVYKKAGNITLPRVAAAQQQAGVAVSAADAAPGDLVFYGAPAHHVAIYLGGGMIRHAPRTGDVVRVVKVTNPGTPTNYRRVIRTMTFSSGSGQGIVSGI